MSFIGIVIQAKLPVQYTLSCGIILMNRQTGRPQVVARMEAIMSVDMNVKISNIVYDRVIRFAGAQQQPLSQVVEWLLTSSLPSSDEETTEALDEADKALDREIAAYHDLHPVLWQKYPHEHVALFQGKLVDHDLDGVALSLRIYQRFPDETVLIRQVEPDPEREIRMRSPRFMPNGASI